MNQLDTWEGTLSVFELDALIALVSAAMLIGQRPGDFTLGRALPGGAAAWPSGRCFNEDIEIRWWPGDVARQSCVLILNRLPEGWTAPSTLTQRTPMLAGPPEMTHYLCVGQLDERSREGPYQWWEARYGRAFEYLSSPPSSLDKQGDSRGRVYLRTLVYELTDGRMQHRLLGFEHAKPQETT